MIAATSAIPFLLIAAVLVAVVAGFQVRSYLRSVRRASAVPMESLGERREVTCGYRVRTPSILAVSFPLAKLVVAKDELVLRGPVGDYEFLRSRGAAVKPMRRTAIFHRLRIEADDLSAVVFVRDLTAVTAALEAARWTY